MKVYFMQKPELSHHRVELQGSLAGEGYLCNPSFSAVKRAPFLVSKIKMKIPNSKLLVWSTKRHLCNKKEMGEFRLAQIEQLTLEQGIK